MTAERAPLLAALLTVAEVAVFLKVSPKTVRRLIRQGMPCVYVGRSIRFESAKVLGWLRQEV